MVVVVTRSCGGCKVETRNRGGREGRGMRRGISEGKVRGREEKRRRGERKVMHCLTMLCTKF